MASLRASNDPVGLNGHVQQPQKRGRPRIESNSSSSPPGNEIAQRKERVRLAQRAYRNRRDTKVDGLKARVARLEYALEQTINSFTRLQKLATEVDNLPPKMALEISRTALDIASAAQKLHSKELFQEALPGNGGAIDSEGAAAHTDKEPVGREVRPNETAQVSSTSTASKTSSGFTSLDVANSIPPIDSSLTIPTQKQNLPTWGPEIERGTWFTALLHQLCSEQGIQLLTSPQTTVDDLHPALSIHLAWMTIDQLRAQCLRTKATFEHVHEDPEPSVILGSPKMYRSVEGSDGLVVPRMLKLEPQQLIHGRTRTKLGTSLQDFQGEWLEPIDVQEYLEYKGIFLGSGGLGGMLQITIPEGTLRDIWTQDANAIFTEEIQRSRIMSTSWTVAIEPQDDELTVPSEAIREVEEHQTQRLARQDHPLVAIEQEHFVVPQSFREYQTQSGAPVTPESLISVTLHLDRLMRFLVRAACCLGSGPGIRKEAMEHALRLSIAKH